MHDSPRGRGLGVALAAFVAICVCSLGWPLFPVAAAAFPARVFGIPFALAWSIFWMLATFVGVGLYHFASGGEEPR